MCQHIIIYLSEYTILPYYPLDEFIQRGEFGLEVSGRAVGEIVQNKSKTNEASMNIHWHVAGLDLEPELKVYGERRIQFALGRFAQRISRLDLHLSDENGPKGGVDKSCRLIARIVPNSTIAIQDIDADFHALLDRAVERLARSIRRELGRRRDHRNVSPGAGS